MAIDLKKCVGCQSCTVACKQENDLSFGFYWNDVNTIGPIGRFPNVEMYYQSLMCQHCSDPACVKACPTKASHKLKNGVVLIDDKKCFGCGYCIMACPYVVRFYNKEKGVVEKCTLCIHRIPLKKPPACVQACPQKARYFGDLDDPESEIYQLVHKRAGRQMLAEMGTDPNVYYFPP